MKLNIKKYATRGALLACGGLLFSCDGDDGRPGRDGNAGTPGLPYTPFTNADLINPIFTAAQLRLILDPSTTGAYTGTPEVHIDFDSPYLANLENASIDVGLLWDQIVGNPQLRIIGLDAPGTGVFTIDQIKGDVDHDGDIDVFDNDLFTDSTFTTLTIHQNTYIGTFTTLVGTTADPVTLSQNAPAQRGVTATPAPIGGFVFQEAQQQSGGTTVIVQDTSSSPRLDLWQLTAEQVAFRFQDPSGEDLVFVYNRGATTAGDIATAGLVFDATNTVVVGPGHGNPAPNVGNLVRVVAAAGSTYATGHFRLDIDTTAGGDPAFTPTGQGGGFGGSAE